MKCPRISVAVRVAAFARNHHIPVEWAQKGVCKEDYVQSWLRPMRRAGRYGVYFIFQSMEQGPSFRCSLPKFPTQDPNHRILRPQRSRFTHYYFYLRDQTLGQELNRNHIGFRKNDNAFLAVDDIATLQAAADRLTSEVIRARLEYGTLILGPKFSKRERGAMNLRRFYAVNQIEYCRNVIFQRNFPIHRIFERSCEIGLWQLTAHKIAEIFGSRVTKKLKGKLHTTLEQIEHGHHIFRAYFKHAFVKQYEKFSTFLRNETCSNNLADFRIHDTPMIRLMEVLLHGGTAVGGWPSKQIHDAILTAYGISVSRYGLNQLRYDLRKMKAHGLVERDGKRYAYRLTDKGAKVALTFVIRAVP